MGRATGLSHRPTSLLQQASLRLLLAGLVSGLATIAAGVWILRAASDAASARQLADAADYVATRAEQFERRWEAEAFSLKTQVEMARLTDESRLAAARLTSFFTALGGVGPFPAAVVRDREGAVRFRFPAGFDATQVTAEPQRWLLDRTTGTLYRVLRQPLWLGDAGMGTLLLLRPLDHALFHEMAYPGTRLTLAWDGQALASSLGSAGIEPGRGLLRDVQSLGHHARLPWTADDAGPTVLVERVNRLPFDIGWVLIAGPAASLVMGALAWLLLSRWLRAAVRRLTRVEAAVSRFDATAADGGGAAATLVAEAGTDEIGRLAAGTRTMMAGVLQARAEQARTQVRLEELNLSLEQRVEQRTRELVASRDAALAGARAKEMFVANMSHELRTPMNGLLGALELLGRTPLDERQRALIATAATSGEALLSVINDVLDFSKINSGKVELVREPVRLRALVEGTVTLFAASASGKGLTLSLEWDDRLPAWVSVDAVRLRQILLNLLGNAIKFTNAGSVVMKVQLGQDDAAGCAVFEVTDSGIGIAADQLQAIFDPFVQADGSRLRQHSGTGLGLAISRRLAEAMDGRIDVRSQLGAGSTFRLQIPLLEAPSGAEPTGTGSAPVTALEGRVLLVEDNVVNRIVASTMLAQLGLQVVECGNGREACDALQAEAFDAVLMDVMMPVMDGLAATREIRAREAREGLPHTPIVALTASAMRQDIDAALEAGMDDHVAKPFSMQQLGQVLARQLRVVPGA